MMNKVTMATGDLYEIYTSAEFVERAKEFAKDLGIEYTDEFLNDLFASQLVSAREVTKEEIENAGGSNDPDVKHHVRLCTPEEYEEYVEKEYSDLFSGTDDSDENSCLHGIPASKNVH